ncbi:glycosyltransferase [Candidatus Pacearchaeota archaeon]|nr:glycosyltransferase [Candidatus Pacearchaeota archaeon]
MRILELTNYTAGSCGVSKRVIRESQMLAKEGNIVRIFSSNLVKGNSQICQQFEKIGDIQITRFNAKKLGGESFLNWSFEKEAISFMPDIIIAHAYRHLHTLKALKIASKIKVPCLIVTHAPFKREKTRNLSQNLIVWLYDLLIGRKTIAKFDKVLIIAPWEVKYLLNLGISKDKLVYSPNGIDIEFFKRKIEYNKSRLVIYTGRIAPIKNLEVLIDSMKLVNSEVNLLIYGPAEKDYLIKLANLVIKNKLQRRVSIINKEYDLQQQLKLLDKSEIFVLPSKSEGMPQSLIEAMARAKIVIGSDIISINSIIHNGDNGFTFKENDSKDLAKKINLVLELNSSKRIAIKKAAVSSVKAFKWPLIIKDLNNLLITVKKNHG